MTTLAKSVTVAFLKAELVEVFDAWNKGGEWADAIATARILASAIRLLLLAETPSIDMLLMVAEDLDRAEEGGAPSARMDNARALFAKWFEVVVSNLRAEHVPTLSEAYDAGVLAERARWTQLKPVELQTAIETATPKGEKSAIGWIAGTVNENLVEASYAGPEIPTLVVDAILKAMPGAEEVEPGMWFISATS